MWEEEFIEKYNHWIERYKKACIFFSNPNTQIKDMEEWQEEFGCIVKTLGKLKFEYEHKTGQKMNLQEELNGFKI